MRKVLRKRVSTWSLLSAIALIGLLLAAVFAFSKPLPEYLVAKSNLSAGGWISLADLDRRKLDLGSSATKYLTIDSLENGFYIREFVAEGELILLRHLSDSLPKDRTTVVVSPSLDVSPSITPGAWIQIWRTVEGPKGFVSERIVERCQVVSILEDESLVSERGSQVEVSITEQESALILQTISAQQDLYLLVTP